MELEADHIGILLLGAAGFDPHIAPSVYKKLGKIAGDLGVFDFISTHPSSTKRARLLSEHMVMAEAMELYVEASAGKECKGFF
jgi:predicted Zn-dependent protease